MRKKRTIKIDDDGDNDDDLVDDVDGDHEDNCVDDLDDDDDDDDIDKEESLWWVWESDLVLF